jgi:hypothetical protein
MAREINRAHILLALDEKMPELLIMQVLGVGRTTIWRTRSAYVEKGWIMLCTMWHVLGNHGSTESISKPRL